MKIGYIGLGKMGKNMVLRLLEQGIEVVAWNRSPAPFPDVQNAGAEIAKDIKSLILNLAPPRIIWLMLPAGDTTEEFLQTLKPLLSQGDLVIDGANSFYKDAIRRSQELASLGIHLMDIGVSGGPGGARNGACLMVGGSAENYQKINRLVEAVSAPTAYGHFGPVGAGHFAKMVHNGIEYGLMQAIAEGAAVLKMSQMGLDLAEVFRVYNNHSVIESRLVGWAQEALAEDAELNNTSSKIGHSGEGEWTIQTAKKFGVEVPVIEASFKVRTASSGESENFRDKIVSALRGKFGGHKVS